MSWVTKADLPACNKECAQLLADRQLLKGSQVERRQSKVRRGLLYFKVTPHQALDQVFFIAPAEGSC